MAEHSFAWDRARLLEYFASSPLYRHNSKLSCSSKEVDSSMNSSAVSFISSVICVLLFLETQLDSILTLVYKVVWHTKTTVYIMHMLK